MGRVRCMPGGTNGPTAAKVKSRQAAAAASKHSKLAAGSQSSPDVITSMVRVAGTHPVHEPDRAVLPARCRDNRTIGSRHTATNRLGAATHDAVESALHSSDVAVTRRGCGLAGKAIARYTCRRDREQSTAIPQAR